MVERLRPEHTYISQDPLFNKIAAEATRVGMNWAVGSWPNFVNGKHLAETPYELVHDLGHWLVSPRWLRTKRHFGLGHPADFRAHKGLVSDKRCQLLEEEASLLGIVLYRELGAPFKTAFHMAEEHNWFTSAKDEVAITIERLKKKGLWTTRRARIWAAIWKKGAPHDQQVQEAYRSAAHAAQEHRQGR